MAATLKNIADQLGVSVMTVSKALNDKGRVRPATRDLIRSEARRVGYRPNAAAKAVVTGKFNCASLLLDANKYRNHLPVALLVGVQDAVARRGMHLTISRMSDDQLTSEEHLPDILAQTLSDGLLVTYKVAIPPRLVGLIHKYRIPCIWIDSRFPHDCIMSDHPQGARDAVKQLLALGHRRIAFVDNHPADPLRDEPLGHHFSLLERREGYTDAMIQAGLKPWLINTGTVPPVEADRMRWACQWLKQDPSRRPTAVITYVPATAVGVFRAAVSLGLSVPGDLSLITFSSDGEIPGNPMAAMRLSDEALGAGAVEMLLEKIDNPSRLLEPRRVPIPFIPGPSLGPPLASD